MNPYELIKRATCARVYELAARGDLEGQEPAGLPASEEVFAGPDAATEPPGA